MWTLWREKDPVPGVYVYVRDLDAPDIYEIGWAMGVPGNMKVAVVNDPTMTPQVFDEWQIVATPKE